MEFGLKSLNSIQHARTCFIAKIINMFAQFIRQYSPKYLLAPTTRDWNCKQIFSYSDSTILNQTVASWASQNSICLEWFVSSCCFFISFLSTSNKYHIIYHQYSLMNMQHFLTKGKLKRSGKKTHQINEKEYFH